MSTLTMVTPYNASSPLTPWWLTPSQVSGDGYFPGIFSAAQSNSTRVVFILNDGTKTIVTGTGLNGLSNLGWTSLTGIKHVSSDESVTYERVEGFVPAAGIGTGLPNGLGLYGLFMDGADTLIGSSSSDKLIGDNGFAGPNNGGADSIWGGGGADALSGGAGDDVFRIESGDFVAGETIDGGFDNDELQFFNAGEVDLRDGVLSSIERYRFQTGTSEITINDSVLFGPTFNGGTISPTVIGSSAIDTINIIVDGNRVPPLEFPITFIDWSPDDRIIIQVNFGRITFGTGQNDVIIGSSVADNISGSGGDDVLIGGGGGDTLRGGADDDRFGYASQADIDGDLIDGGAGLDTLVTLEGIASYNFTGATFASTEGNAIDTLDLFNTTAQNVIFNASQFGTGKIATDLSIVGDAGAETVTISNATGFSAENFTFSNWNAAVDRIIIDGGIGNDTITGSSVADTIRGGGDSDTLFGGDGADNLSGGLGADVLDGGANLAGTYDYARYDDANHGNLVINLANAGLNTGAAAGDTYVGIEGLVGGLGGDTITGNAAANALWGMAGNDMIEGGAGGDYLNGGDGSDTLSYASSNAAVKVNLNGATASGGHAQGDVFTRFESLTGSDYNDTLSGNTGNNVVRGGAGNDSINAWHGNDYIFGGLGNDTLKGSLGVDRFHFDTALNAATNVDTMFDFSTVDDFVMLENAVFTAIGPGGFLAATRFATVQAGGDATTVSHRIVYELSTGNLFYDSDGSGAQAKVHFATLNAGTALAAADIYVY